VWRRVLAHPTLVLSALNWCVSKYVLRRRFLVKTIMGNEFTLDLRVAGISRAVAIYGEREPSHEMWIRENVRSDMVVVDLGANIGYYALMEGSLVGPRGVVYAIEPDPRNIGLLRRNVENNNLQEVIQIHPLAISGQDGVGWLHVANESNLNFLSRVKPGVANGDTVEVRTATLSTFLSDKRSPDLVRMDIEGGEVEVLGNIAAMSDRFKSGFRVFCELHQYCYSEGRSLELPLVEMLRRGFQVRLLVARHGHDFSDLGYSPTRSVRALGSVEHLYDDVEDEDAIRIACDHPQRARYLLLEKA
jgi:FkbM family methyltransferase